MKDEKQEKIEHITRTPIEWLNYRYGIAKMKKNIEQSEFVNIDKGMEDCLELMIALNVFLGSSTFPHTTDRFQQEFQRLYGHLAYIIATLKTYPT